jgi:hypothetical protein
VIDRHAGELGEQDDGLLVVGGEVGATRLLG